VSEGRPDFDDSPEVLIWMRMFRGVLRAGRALFSAVAAFVDVSVWIVWRLGIDPRIFALLDCKVPMKCHWISSGNSAALSTNSCT